MGSMSTLWAVVLGLVLLGASPAQGATLRQAQATHAGNCGEGQGIFHNVTIWTNDTGVTVTNVLTRILSGGTGIQGYYTTRSSDNYITAFSGHTDPVGVATGSEAQYDKPVPFGPGESIRFVHWCYPPDVYDYHIFFEYLVP
jgi:hypothetical protein